MDIDWRTLVNWIVSGVIAFIFTYLAHRLQRQRELEQLEKRFRHERDLQQAAYIAKIDEIKQQLKQQRDDATMHEVLPTALTKLQDAVGRYAVVGPGPKESPVLNDYSPQALEDFMERMRLEENHKYELRQASDKTHTYSRIRFWYELKEAHKVRDDYHNYLIYKKVYIDDDLYNLFMEADTQLGELLNAARTTHEEPRDRETIMAAAKVYRESRGRLEPLVSRIEELVKQCLSS